MINKILDDYNLDYEMYGKDIAKVDKKGVLTISPNARPGDSFTIKTTAVTEDPFISPKATIVDYLVQ